MKNTSLYYWLLFFSLPLQVLHMPWTSRKANSLAIILPVSFLRPAIATTIGYRPMWGSRLIQNIMAKCICINWC